jgi:triacylglycerol esterase/lipase EstA (alpha/beta hydrolase family)
MPQPTVILPGYLAGAADYQPLQQSLQDLGYPTVTVPLRWQDWLPTIGGRSVAPILRQLDATVQQVRQQFDGWDINLIGHSAGGWLARIYLGEKPYDIHARIPAGARQADPPLGDDSDSVWSAHKFVTTLVTLGTPHTSQERWTLKNLNFVNQTYPGAFHTDVRYVCVAGQSVQGQRWGGGWQGWLAQSSYQLTCGTGGCWGDGITPIAAAHLDGAQNIVVAGAGHSPKRDRPWYGSPQFIAEWSQYLS